MKNNFQQDKKLADLLRKEDKKKSFMEYGQLVIIRGFQVVEGKKQRGVLSSLG